MSEWEKRRERDKEIIERDDFAVMLLDYLEEMVGLIQACRDERILKIRDWIKRELGS